jgi:hypothetical protein
VWQSGIPHHETLIALAYGHQWIDQQWLSQLLSYAIYLAGGLRLVSLVNVIFLVAGVGGSVAAARKLGGPFLAVLVTFPACVALITPWREVRTQTFIVPLFVAVVYLLARDARDVRDGRAPSRRVYWCLPMLVLWANLHGTVTLGAGLVALRGLTIAWERRRQLTRQAGAWLRPLALTIGGPVSILLTPYGLSIIGYYHTTMVGGTLRQAVREWQPVTTQPVQAVVLLGLAGVAIWSFGRNSSKTTLWEKIALIALAAGGVSVWRNVLFFGLFALMVVPVSLGLRTRAQASRPSRANLRLNGAILALAAVLALGTAISTIVRPAARIEYAYQRPGVLAAVLNATRHDPSLRVMAEERMEDWLLWRDPSLSGKVAADARFELLSPAQLGPLQCLFQVTCLDYKRAAVGYRLLVLDRKYEPETVKGFLAEPGHRVLYDDGQRLVILRSVNEAARG